jgi:tetratricopeptide (TPR) repeat protein
VPVTAALIGGFSALADANPAVTVSQSDLAWTHDVIGSQFAHRSKLTEAQAAYERALAIYQKLVAAESTGPSDRNSLANCHTKSADLLRKAGRRVEARTACERSLALREPLVKEHPQHRGAGDLLTDRAVAV